VDGGAGGDGDWWAPSAGDIPWQWELDHALSLSSAADMGTGEITYTGAAAAPPVVYDIDGFDNPASTITGLHALGAHVICYIEAGAAENYRPDYSQFPAAALGSTVSGYSNEKYLNINDPTVLSVIKARIDMCAGKGCDAIEPDIDDSYASSTGFTITQAQNVTYDCTLATYAHSKGLGWGLKNGDDPTFASQMLPHVDFVLDEQCFQYSTCTAFYPSFRQAGKAVFEVEYQDQGGPSPSSFCPTANAYGFNSIQFTTPLDGTFRVPCR